MAVPMFQFVYSKICYACPIFIPPGMYIAWLDAGDGNMMKMSKSFSWSLMTTPVSRRQTRQRLWKRLTYKKLNIELVYGPWNATISFRAKIMLVIHFHVFKVFSYTSHPFQSTATHVDQDKVSATAPVPKEIAVNVPDFPKASTVGSQDWWAKSWWILVFYISINVSVSMVVGLMISPIHIPGNFLFILDCNL